MSRMISPVWAVLAIVPLSACGFDAKKAPNSGSDASAEAAVTLRYVTVKPGATIDASDLEGLPDCPIVVQPGADVRHVKMTITACNGVTEFTIGARAQIADSTLVNMSIGDDGKVLQSTLSHFQAGNGVDISASTLELGDGRCIGQMGDKTRIVGTHLSISVCGTSPFTIGQEVVIDHWEARWSTREGFGTPKVVIPDLRIGARVTISHFESGLGHFVAGDDSSLEESRFLHGAGLNLGQRNKIIRTTMSEGSWGGCWWPTFDDDVLFEDTEVLRGNVTNDLPDTGTHLLAGSRFVRSKIECTDLGLGKMVFEDSWLQTSCHNLGLGSYSDDVGNAEMYHSTIRLSAVKMNGVVMRESEITYLQFSGADKPRYSDGGPFIIEAGTYENCRRNYINDIGDGQIPPGVFHPDCA